MSPRGGRPPLLIRWLLAFRRLDGRRDEIATDLTELFDSRVRTRGRFYASWRLLRDVVSVILAPRLSARPLRGRERSGGFRAWLLDVRYGVRLLGQHPAVIGATVGGLALSIAVGTTVFTIVNASVIRQYGMDDPMSVVRVQMLFPQGMSTGWPYHAFAEMRDHATTSRVESLTHQRLRFSMAAGEATASLESIHVVSGGYLTTLGGRAVLGRTLQPSDDGAGASPVVVLSQRFWTARVGADPAIVGKTIFLAGAPVTVVGVVDRGFTGPFDAAPAFWAPFGSYGALFRDRPIDRASTLPVTVVARVAPNVERTAAERELSVIAASLPDAGVSGESGVFLRATGVRLDGAASPMDGPDSAGMLIVVAAMLLIVGLVLALACANVANLLLASAAARTREIGIRLALGASRGRIVRQLLGESVLIGVMAGAAGLVLSLWLTPIAAALIGPAEAVDLRPDSTVLLFTAALAVLSGAGAGLAPARHGSRGDLVAVLKSQDARPSGLPTASRLRRWFIGFQAAASIVLLVVAALFLRAALHITRVDLGFDADRLVTVTPSFPISESGQDKVDVYWRSALERASRLPAVERVSLALYPPFGGSTSVSNFERRGRTYRIYENRTDAEYFAAAGFQLVRGRGYSADEVHASAPVAVITESIVRHFFGDTEPIGATLSVMSERLSAVTVVGVVADSVTSRVRAEVSGTIYRPLSPADRREARLVVRSVSPAAVVRDLETTLLTVDPRVRPLVNVMSDDVDQYLAEPKALASLSGAVAILALALAVLGVYGVTTFVVSQRMWELQVRQAIGASTNDIIRLLVRQSLTPVVVGLISGLGAALIAVRALTPALAGVSPYDPAALLGAVIVLSGAALTAVALPALRAARIDPAGLLRQSQ